jgi:enolase-phosphatase E1
VTRHFDPSIRTILLDIEGTTTPIAFVYQVLFPYAKSHMAEFLRRHGPSPDVRADLDELMREHAKEVREHTHVPSLEGGTPESFVPYIDWLIDKDRKLAPLKSLEGKIWAEGYARGELHSEVYPDVPAALKRWQSQQKTIAIFSSGSVWAQKLLFAHTQAGDLTARISTYFDTNVGSKIDPESYQKIANSLKRVPGEIVFISDVVRELDAAHAADFHPLLCERSGNHPQPAHAYRVVRNLDEVFPITI